MVKSGLEALAENQTTNELLTQKGGSTPKKGPHAAHGSFFPVNWPFLNQRGRSGGVRDPA